MLAFYVPLKHSTNICTAFNVYIPLKYTIKCCTNIKKIQSIKLFRKPKQNILFTLFVCWLHTQCKGQILEIYISVGYFHKSFSNYYCTNYSHVLTNPVLSMI